MAICGYSMRLILRFYDAIRAVEPKTDNWLAHLTSSEAMLACIGAGPWAIGRRQTVQQRAIDLLDGNDLSAIVHTHPFFPLMWQKVALQQLVTDCNVQKISFDYYWRRLLSNDVGHAQQLLAQNTDTNALKCWSLFVRDRMNKPAFAIDRHVRRWLQHYDLPQSELKILKLWDETRVVCNDVPQISEVNRGIVGLKFSGNPILTSRSKAGGKP